MVVKINGSETEVLSDSVIPSHQFKDDQKIWQVELPEQTRKVESFAFSGCENLRRLTLNEGLKIVDSCAFFGCCSLESVEFPGSIMRLGAGAFRDCSKLNSVSFRAGTETIIVERNTFANCAGRDSIYKAIEDENRKRKENAERPRLMSIVRSAAEVINYINSKDESGQFKITSLGGFEITSRSAIGTEAPQFRQFFVEGLSREQAKWTVHYEVLPLDGGLNIEGHSERTGGNTGGTPIEVHRCLRDQFWGKPGFEFKGNLKDGNDRSFRFGAHHVECVNRTLKEVLEDVSKALRDLDAEFGAYLEYLQKWYYENGKKLAGCRDFDVFNGK